MTVRATAVPALTVMASVPVMLLVVLSFAVIDFVPEVFNVALKLCTPWSALVKV